MASETADHMQQRSQQAPEDLNPFHIAGQQFDRAVTFLPQFKADVIDFLKRPERTVAVEFP
jgi:hypothetical protein